ncbi:restriction endonuclease subunit S [Listeria newyorkensis]|uniref:restriction endonuclease subunit S n=1 Tax=Listeria newyorkensis TaxID=1497681 RepID=UPI00210061C4|nr:restriction endonuclease subunit S [Listeria newyorkensis]
MKKGRIVPRNSILVTCIAGSKNVIGNAAIADREVAFNQQINAIVPDVNTYFLYVHILVSKKKIQDKSTGGMKGLVSKSTFQNIKFMYPPKDLQNKFGEYFIEITKQKQLLKQSLTELENNFNSLMQRAFNGELFKGE